MLGKRISAGVIHLHYRICVLGKTAVNGYVAIGYILNKLRFVCTLIGESVRRGKGASQIVWSS